MWNLLACTEPMPGDVDKPTRDVWVDTETTLTVDSDPGETGETSTPGPIVVEITPGPTERRDPLICTADEAGEVTWTWTVDGAPFTGAAFTTITPGDTIFAGYLRADAVWACTATLADRTGSAATTVIAADLAALDPLLTPVVEVVDGKLVYRGPLATEPRVAARYGFDGWAMREAPEGATEDPTDEGDRYWGLDAELTSDGTAWSSPIEVPASARVVHARFSSDAGADDNGGLDYTWDFTFPSVGPMLSWNDVARPENGIVVTWEGGVPGLGVVEYGPDEENVAWAVGTEVETLHHVALTDLPSDTTWVYRVRDASGRTSPWYSFTVASQNLDSFVYLVASDMQDNGIETARWSEVATEMVTVWPEARFVMTPGDLTANNQPGGWWLYFDGGRELFAHVPIVPAVGNHDTPSIRSDPDTTAYRRWFDLPTALGDEDQYRLDFGTMRIFALNTEVSSELDEGGAQYVWMEEEIDALWTGDTRVAEWVITQGHHPAYDIGKRFAEECPNWRTLTKLFPGNVDLDIRAHEHIYQRFDPVRFPLLEAASYGLGDDQGVAYLDTPAAGFEGLQTEVITGDAPGTDQMGLLAWPELAPDQTVVEGIHGYLVGDVAPDAMTVTFYGMGNSEAPTSGVALDELLIQR